MNVQDFLKELPAIFREFWGKRPVEEVLTAKGKDCVIVIRYHNVGMTTLVVRVESYGRFAVEATVGEGEPQLVINHSPTGERRAIKDPELRDWMTYRTLRKALSVVDPHRQLPVFHFTAWDSLDAVLS